jgi:hypothetical protein
MGYFMESGRYADTEDVTLESAKSVTGASGTGTAKELGDKAIARLELTVSAIGAGSTLTCTVKTCDTETGTYRTVAAFTGASATGSERLSFSGLDRWVRVDWALAGGTLTATYGIDGEAV